MHSRCDTEALLRLHRLIGDRPRTMSRLIRNFGSAELFFEQQTRTILLEMGIRPETIRKLGEAPDDLQALVDHDLKWLSQPDHHLVVLGSESYPPLLSSIFDPPALLFAVGDIELLLRDQLAIVGSRRLSMSGKRCAKRIAGELVSAGLVVTSGLALGIDAAAHEGAIEAGGSTVAVLGCGCDIDYPASNRRLAAEIRTCGLVVSEFPPGTRAAPHHFPQRNRIVTGMALGTLVVEATQKSGSLISARYAIEQGREVFAVPGGVDGPHHRGCHQLIREGAKLTESVKDILEDLPGYEASLETPSARVDLTGPKKKLVGYLDSEPVTIDELIDLTGLPVAEAMTHLVELELIGVVASERGGYILASMDARS